MLFLIAVSRNGRRRRRRRRNRRRRHSVGGCGDHDPRAPSTTDEIQNSEKNIETLLDSLLIEYDILLTKNLNRYIQKASKGTVNLNKTYSNWDLKDNKINIEELLQNFQKKDSFNFALKKIPPNHIVYKKLKSALAIINSYPDYTFNKTEIDHKIVLNDTNTAIIEIKKKL